MIELTISNFYNKIQLTSYIATCKVLEILLCIKQSRDKLIQGGPIIEKLLHTIHEVLYNNIDNSRVTTVSLSMLLYVILLVSQHSQPDGLLVAHVIIKNFFFNMSSNIIVEHVLMKICEVRVTSTSKSHNVQAPL